MHERKVAPYGFWKSPITANLCASSYVGVDDPMLDSEQAYWKKSRPKEGGLYVLVRQGPEGRIVEITPKEFNRHYYGSVTANHVMHI